MRDPRRIERVLGKLRQLWLTMPDQRFCQLVENITSLAAPVETDEEGIRKTHCVFYLEDDKFEELIEQFEVKVMGADAGRIFGFRSCS